MACRGYFLALDEPCMALLLAEDGNDERIIEVIQELDMTDAPDECGVDKAWDGIHRWWSAAAPGRGLRRQLQHPG
jgi:hypothetical protein